MRIYSLSTLKSRINEPFIRTVWASIRSTFAPISCIALSSTFVSLTFGMFSIVTVSSVITAADKIASAAFFAPPISTSPTKGLPPLITYCSISHLDEHFPNKHVIIVTIMCFCQAILPSLEFPIAVNTPDLTVPLPVIRHSFCRFSFNCRYISAGSPPHR